MKKSKKLISILEKTLLAIILIGVCIIFLYPVFELVAGSFTKAIDLVKHGFSFENEFAGFENYVYVFKKNTLVDAIKISVARTVVGTIVGTVCNVLLAYIISRKNFRFSKAITIFLLIAYVVDSGIIPRLAIYRKINLVGSFWVYIIPCAINILYVMILKTFMEGFPKEIEETAYLDGAGCFRILFNVIIPQAKSCIAIIMIFIATDQWNSWFDVMLYNRLEPKYSTIQYELMKLLTATYANYATSAQAVQRTGVLPPTYRYALTALVIVSAFAMAIATQCIIAPTAEKKLQSIIRDGSNVTRSVPL